VTPEERLAALGLTLPPLTVPAASYVPYRISRGLLFVSGHVPRKADGSLRTGLVGRDTTIEEAYADARNVGLQLLAVAKAALGELSRITAVVKLLGMVNAHPSFGEHPKVVNGCSDLLIEVLGHAGQHARSAIGVGSLPGGVTVEVEAIFEFD
jgi:enamine deaminase RidA (YjgF/YER057c/UK114 family)